MNIYEVTYSLLGSGTVEIVARSKKQAEEIVFDLSDDQLIANAHFHKSLEIETIEKLS
jgi:hypothetical protein